MGLECERNAKFIAMKTYIFLRGEASMKKKIVSLLLAATMAISALTGCGSDSKDSKSGSVAASARDDAASSAPLQAQDSGRTGDTASSEGADESKREKKGKDTHSRESGGGSAESKGKDESTAPETLMDAAEIARAALDGQIKSSYTVEYSYMNTITCQINGIPVSAETANQMKAYGMEDALRNILTVSKESDLRKDGRTLKQEKFWYNQDGDVYSSEYDEISGGFTSWQKAYYGPGMSWMNETGLEVYQEIAEGNIKPTLLESADKTKYILYFVLDGEQTKSLFGRLIDDVRFDGSLVYISDADMVDVQVAVNKMSYQPYSLSIKATDFLSNGTSVTDYDISLAYTNWSTSEEPLEIPQEVLLEAQ